MGEGASYLTRKPNEMVDMTKRRKKISSRKISLFGHTFANCKT